MSEVSPGFGATRRDALKKILLVSVASCAALLGTFEIVGSSSKVKSQNDRVTEQTETSQSQTSVSSNTTSDPATAPINYTIKVAYFGFQTVQTTGTSEEYLTLPAPVFLQDVLEKIKEEHIVLAAMLPIMAVTINGVSAEGNPQLSNNSEVDIIPIYAGG